MKRPSLCFRGKACSSDEELDREEQIIRAVVCPSLSLESCYTFIWQHRDLHSVSPGLISPRVGEERKDAVLRVLSILINRATGLSAGSRTNQCQRLHENISVEERRSETGSAGVSWHKTG